MKAEYRSAWSIGETLPSSTDRNSQSRCFDTVSVYSPLFVTIDFANLVVGQFAWFPSNRNFTKSARGLLYTALTLQHSNAELFHHFKFCNARKPCCAGLVSNLYTPLSDISLMNTLQEVHRLFLIIMHGSSWMIQSCSPAALHEVSNKGPAWKSSKQSSFCWDPQSIHHIYIHIPTPVLSQINTDARPPPPPRSTFCILLCAQSSTRKLFAQLKRKTKKKKNNKKQRTTKTTKKTKNQKKQKKQRLLRKLWLRHFPQFFCFFVFFGLRLLRTYFWKNTFHYRPLVFTISLRKRLFPKYFRQFILNFFQLKRKTKNTKKANKKQKKNTHKKKQKKQTKQKKQRLWGNSGWDISLSFSVFSVYGCFGHIFEKTLSITGVWYSLFP